MTTIPGCPACDSPDGIVGDPVSLAGVEIEQRKCQCCGEKYYFDRETTSLTELPRANARTLGIVRQFVCV